MNTSPHPGLSGTPAYRELPLGAVRPSGWLADQLLLQASGLTGSLEEIWPDVGPDSAWLGGNGEAWERGPYYLDGLVPLAHLTGGMALLGKAQHWIESLLGSRRPDGDFGPTSNDDWWPRMVALKALAQHCEATGDARVTDLMTGYFRYQLANLSQRPLRDWGRVRGADNALTVSWLHERTQEPFLLDLLDLVLAQTADWGTWLRDFPSTGVTRTWDHMTHVVNVAMGLKTPAVRYLRDGDPVHQRMTDEGLANLDRHHGQVHGMFSGDEWLAGPEAHRGVELCAVVEAMYSLEQMVRIFGAVTYADRLEGLAYNLLPASLSADMTSHQYHQQANQVLATIARRDWTQADDDCTIFGLEPSFGCCTANLHQGWPKLVRSLWMEGAGRSLVAIAYGPSTVRWDLDGRSVVIEEATDYPFADDLTFTIRTSGPVSFTLRLRNPGWCDSPSVAINGRAADRVASNGFLELERSWQEADVVTLRLPMRVRALSRPNGATGLALGPLVLSYSPGEIWSRLPASPAFGDWEVRPRRSWNFALAIDPAEVGALARVERAPPASPPFGLRTGAPPHGVDGVALKVWVPGRRAPTWELAGGSAAPPPTGPFSSSDLDHPIPLVPYGSARLRITEFPIAPPSDLGSRGVADPPP